MINNFSGKYEFLSNFYNCPVFYDGLQFSNSEAAFHSQKTLDLEDRKRFTQYNAGKSKREGRRVDLRPDWEEVKDQIMYEICKAKFTQNKDLMKKLIETYPLDLLEGTTGWHDNYWGSCECEKCKNVPGKNKLGVILMKIREELMCSNDLKKNSTKDESKYVFDAKTAKEKLVIWLRDYFNNGGNPINAVVGCSGGKDSTVVLAALVEAIGPERVYAVLMPNGTQHDIEDSYKVCEFLGLKPYEINIADGYSGVLNAVGKHFELTKQATINAAPMVRMMTLKAFSQCVNGRFTCNGNLSELYLGWFTIGGDDSGAIRPLANMTVTEVIAVGKELGLPDWMIDKKPSDGLCGQSDEDKFGFSYKVLDQYIRTGEINDLLIKEKIDTMHNKNKFKLEPIPSFDPFG